MRWCARCAAIQAGPKFRRRATGEGYARLKQTCADWFCGPATALSPTACRYELYAALTADVVRRRWAVLAAVAAVYGRSVGRLRLHARVARAAAMAQRQAVGHPPGTEPPLGSVHPERYGGQVPYVHVSDACAAPSRCGVVLAWLGDRLAAEDVVSAPPELMEPRLAQWTHLVCRNCRGAAALRFKADAEARRRAAAREAQRARFGPW